MLKAGEAAPQFRLGESSLDALLADGPVVLAFFKISCPVCQYTFPYLQRISGAAPVFGISQDDPEATDEFGRAFGLTFPLATDGDGYPVSNAYRLTHVPSIFVVEPDRRISMSVSGFSRQDLEALGRRFGARTFGEGEKTPEFRPG